MNATNKILKVLPYKAFKNPDSVYHPGNICNIIYSKVKTNTYFVTIQNPDRLMVFSK
jgi:hypothetical protein